MSGFGTSGASGGVCAVGRVLTRVFLKEYLHSL